MTDDAYDAQIRDLVVLGRSIDPSPSAVLVTESVMARVAALPEPTRASRFRRLLGTTARWLEPRGRRAAVTAVAVVMALLATPPVRAAVADWLGFGGVIVEPGSPAPGPAPPPPEVPGGPSVAQAASTVGFTLWVPSELGTPHGLEVSSDRRIVSMTWSDTGDGVIRLDQFDGRLDYTIAKRSPGVRFVPVAGNDALWFEEPHEVALLEPDGSRRTETARLAGHTLIWQADHTTLRIEGDVTLQRATDIAESAVPMR